MNADQSSITLGGQEEEIAQYKSISPLAVMVLLLGVASCLALAHPMMWLCPIATLLLAYFAMKSIQRAGGAIAGRLATRIGVWLAVLFLCWGVSNFFVSRGVVFRQAKQMADQWVALIEKGDLQYAHQWTLPYVSRETAGVPLDAYYRSGGDGEKEYDTFYGSGFPKRLAAITESQTIDYLSCDQRADDRINRYFTFRYRLNGEKPVDFHVVVRRFTELETNFRSWTVESVTEVK